MNTANGRQGANLTIDREDIMLEVPRGDRGDVLRVSFTEATTADGKRVAWHSIREFYDAGNGEMKPGKKGITIRGKELRAVADALAKAASGGSTPPRGTPPRPAPRSFGDDNDDL